MPRHSPHALSSLTIKLVHKQNTLANIRLIISNLINYLQFTLQLVVIYMYSVVKYQGKDVPIKIRTLISAHMATYKSSVFGGDDRNRTCDPLNANQVLSQLSYIPIF